MEFPPSWVVNPLDDYETALPAVSSSSEAYTMELMAQLRPTGRILDGFKVVLNGAAPLSRELDLGSIIPARCFKNWKLNFQYWPRDIQIRRNMISSAWYDVPALICSNEAQVLDDQGAGIPANEFMAMLDDAPEDGPESGSVRWAVIIGEDGSPKLQLQSLPCDAVSLSGKPATKG
jgi:hypothetical protein